MYFLCCHDNLFVFTSVEESDCSKRPCHNNGVCDDIDGNFTCVCPMQWSGNFCELGKWQGERERKRQKVRQIEIDRFKVVSILFSDFCFELTDTNECLVSPCEHGGTCTNTHGGYHCTCPSLWMGVNCSGEWVLTLFKESQKEDRFNRICTLYFEMGNFHYSNTHQSLRQTIIGVHSI